MAKGGVRRWLASERIAFRLLEQRGYRVLETHKRIVVDGVEIGEVDALAEDSEGNLYVVEVKAGRLDIHGIRQVYSNALLLNARPLVVCKGFADESARVFAEKLGVTVIELEDVFLLDAEELEDIVYGAVLEAFSEAVRLLLDPSIRIKPEQLEMLRAIAESSAISEAAAKLGKSVRDVAKTLEWLRSLTPLARRSYRSARIAAAVLLQRARIQALIESLENSVERVEALLEKLGA
ncbi:MAG TPA: recombinase RecB [Pyrodictium sp.]|nr:recombinase RecB [Pyrodictium sp.]